MGYAGVWTRIVVSSVVLSLPPKKGHQRNGALWSCGGGNSCDQRFGDPNRGWVGGGWSPESCRFWIYKISWTQKARYLERNWFWVDEMRCSMWQLRTCFLLLLAERMAKLINNAQTDRNNQLLCASQIVAVSFCIGPCTVVRSPGGNIPFDPTKDFCLDYYDVIAMRTVILERMQQQYSHPIYQKRKNNNQCQFWCLVSTIDFYSSNWAALHLARTLCVLLQGQSTLTEQQVGWWSLHPEQNIIFLCSPPLINLDNRCWFVLFWWWA